METGPNIITKELGWVLEKSKIERNVDRLREEVGRRGWWDWLGNYWRLESPVNNQHHAVTSLSSQREETTVSSNQLLLIVC